MNKKEIGKYLEELRNIVGLNRSEAANEIGTTYKSILDWEKGVMPSNDSLVELARLYHVTVDDILECGKQITNEELYDKYPVFKPFDYKEKLDKKKDYYTPYQNQLLQINNRFKELILLFRKRMLSRSEDSELRFLFTNMCSFSDYYYDYYNDEHKDKYLCFVKLLNKAKRESKSSHEYYYEVKKYIEINKYGFNKPFPEYGNPDIDPLKDEQFKSLENWEKDFYLAIFQNSDMIFDASHDVFHLKDFEERYGEEYDHEKNVKRLIKYFIDNGAVLNPWLFTFKKKKRIEHSILERLEDSYCEYIKPLFIQFHDPNNEEDKEYKYGHIANNEANRFLDNFNKYYLSFSSLNRVDPRKILELFKNDDEKEVVDFLYEQAKPYLRDEVTEYRSKRATINTQLKTFYERKTLYENDIEKAKKNIEEINDLQTKFNNGESIFYEYEIEDITDNKNFDHWTLMKRWRNKLNYSQFMKYRDKKLTELLRKEIDKLSLKEIRDKYFAKEEIEIKNV